MIEVTFALLNCSLTLSFHKTLPLEGAHEETHALLGALPPLGSFVVLSPDVAG